MSTEQMIALADEITVALGKGHRGYTIRGPQMDLVVTALRRVAAEPKKVMAPSEQFAKIVDVLESRG